jgi:glycosyltransferase involved in cell wall biosynthesis
MTGITPRILHVIQQLSLGGAARGLIASGKYSCRLGDFRHDVVSLLRPDRRAINLAAEADMTVFDAPGKQELWNQIEHADVVQFHFWNTPELHDLLSDDLPAMRALVFCEINGEHPPHIITRDVVDYADIIVASSPLTLDLPLVRSLQSDQRALVFNGADFARLEGLHPKPRSTFNVGYIGTVDFAKMHPDYVAISAAINIPSARFIVCGDGGAASILKQQAHALGAEDRFEFRGYIEDVREVLADVDVFGYPLCEENYSAAELIVQEVMYASIPPVIFPFGGARNLVAHGENGLVVKDKADYVRAIQCLYENPDERARLGRNAATRARQMFGAENAAQRLNRIYARLMESPKRKREAKVTTRRSGAWALVRSLGNADGDFVTSLMAENDAETIAAERRIARVTPALGDIVLSYRNYYPDDGHLRLWAGLLMSGRQRPATATTELKRSVQLGCDHWRVYLYLAQAAEAAGSSVVAENALRVVRKMAPQYVAHPDV